MLLLRHAESEWNRIFGPTRVDAGLPDPALTTEGRAATVALAPSLAGRGFARIVTSPYRRTLETASILAEALALPIGVEPLARERCAFSCDQGTPASALREAWPQLDLAALEERWWGRQIESMGSLERRAAMFLAKARVAADRDRVLVVTHWGFIRCVTGAEVGNLATVHVAFDQAEPVRS